MDNPRTDYPGAENDSFTASRECFTEALGWLEGPDAAALSHAELEDQLDARGRELLRRMFADHLSLRAMTEPRLAGVRDAQARGYGAVEAGHHRRLASVFGEVEVRRLAYRRRGQPNLYPADAALNVPAERHSHWLRRLAATEASRRSCTFSTAILISVLLAPPYRGRQDARGLQGGRPDGQAGGGDDRQLDVLTRFEEAAAALERATGQHLGKRQVEALTLGSEAHTHARWANRPSARSPAGRPAIIPATSTTRSSSFL